MGLGDIPWEILESMAQYHSLFPLVSDLFLIPSWKDKKDNYKSIISLPRIPGLEGKVTSENHGNQYIMKTNFNIQNIPWWIEKSI